MDRPCGTILKGSVDVNEPHVNIAFPFAFTVYQRGERFPSFSGRSAAQMCRDVSPGRRAPCDHRVRLQRGFEGVQPVQRPGWLLASADR
jgi:hypothetical protein